MTRLEELNMNRVKASELVRNIGMCNTPTDYKDRLALDAQSKLATDAWMRAEREYAAELRRTPTAELERLASSPPLR